MFREGSPKYSRNFEDVDYLNVELHSPASGQKKSSKMGCSLSGTGVIWACFSFLAMTSSLVAFVLPYWLQGELTIPETDTNFTQTFFGLWRRCNYYALVADGHGIEIVHGCGRYSTFWDIPTMWWQIAAVTMCVGCVLALFIGFHSMLACCLDHVVTKTVAQALGVIQFIAGLSIGSSCLLFPLGWEKNADVEQACGAQVSLFQPGDCRIMWGYWLAVGSAGCSILASLFSCRAAKSKTRIRYDRVGL